MSLDKAIQHGKEHRKPYYGSKAVDHTCRPHGSCVWCQNNRLHKHKRKLIVFARGNSKPETSLRKLIEELEE